MGAVLLVAAVAALASASHTTASAAAAAAFVSPRHHNLRLQPPVARSRSGSRSLEALEWRSGTSSASGRQRGQVDARLSFRLTSKRLFNLVKDIGRRSSRTILGGERGGRASEIPHDEVTYR